jgi:transcriptional regulator with XRE-family HTH domain
MRQKSQTDLGKPVGVTFQQIQKYERGTNRISVGRLLEFSKLLKVPLGFFFEDIKTGVAGMEETKAIRELGTVLLDSAEHFMRIKDKRIRNALRELTAALADAGI